MLYGRARGESILGGGIKICNEPRNQSIRKRVFETDLDIIFDLHLHMGYKTNLCNGVKWGLTPHRLCKGVKWASMRVPEPRRVGRHLYTRAGAPRYRPVRPRFDIPPI